MKCRAVLVFFLLLTPWTGRAATAGEPGTDPLALRAVTGLPTSPPTLLPRLFRLDERSPSQRAKLQTAYVQELQVAQRESGKALYTDYEKRILETLPKPHQETFRHLMTIARDHEQRKADLRDSAVDRHEKLTGQKAGLSFPHANTFHLLLRPAWLSGEEQRNISRAVWKVRSDAHREADEVMRQRGFARPDPANREKYSEYLRERSEIRREVERKKDEDMLAAAAGAISQASGAKLRELVRIQDEFLEDMRKERKKVAEELIVLLGTTRVETAVRGPGAAPGPVARPREGDMETLWAHVHVSRNPFDIARNFMDLPPETREELADLQTRFSANTTTRAREATRRTDLAFITRTGALLPEEKRPAFRAACLAVQQYHDSYRKSGEPYLELLKAHGAGSDYAPRNASQVVYQVPGITAAEKEACRKVEREVGLDVARRARETLQERGISSRSGRYAREFHRLMESLRPAFEKKKRAAMRAALSPVRADVFILLVSAWDTVNDRHLALAVSLLDTLRPLVDMDVLAPE